MPIYNKKCQMEGLNNMVHISLQPEELQIN